MERAGGLALYFTDSVSVTIPLNDSYDWLAVNCCIPISAIVMLILFVTFAFISRKTAFGRRCQFMRSG